MDGLFFLYGGDNLWLIIVKYLDFKVSGTRREKSKRVWAVPGIQLMSF